MSTVTRRRLPFLAAAAALALAGPQMGAAQSQSSAKSAVGGSSAALSPTALLSPSNVVAMAAAVRSIDANARLSTPSGSNPRIEATYNGLKYLVFFMNCNDSHSNCKTVQFYMGFSDAKDHTLEQLNEWNKTKRFAKAYRDNEGDPVIEMDIDMDFSGIPQQNFVEYIRTWHSLMNQYNDWVH